ncbi:hypothetical protein [Phenylobacterium sp. 58.2.17]|uniref:hypothetical protein n=1 Tax=Phenylobacterium sp. 58.2.17 TaxID=2969306 RepID=UPI0022646FC6|nr:hypothetical protein [Phenylobacterium sp. 58.2.17]MCX7587800.1 hypothetical protein [Phenylobacterium sp. 58.2.17]
MSHRLDVLIRELAAQPSDYPLDRLEAAVLGVMRRRRHERQVAAALAPVRFASVSLAVAIGLTTGGAAALAAASTPRSFDAFAIAGHLTPSTLLEGR